MKTFCYYLGLAALFTHELDAVLNAEWQLLFHLFSLPEPVASATFIALHFPLFVAFFYFGHHARASIRNKFRGAVCVFLVVHSVLHVLLSGHALYHFEGALSNLYIFAAAAFGGAYFLLRDPEHH